MKSDLLEQIWETAGICEEALNFVADNIKSREKEKEISAMLSDLIKLIQGLADVFKKSGETQYAIIIAYCLNIKNSCEKVLSELERKRYDEAVFLFFLECPALFEETLIAIQYEFEIKNDPEKQDEYNRRMFECVKNYKEYTEKNKDAEYKYEVSIVFLAYNKLEYTKMAIESIFKYTDFDSGKVELITVNNGSSDGTEEYFNSLPHTKKINLKHNVNVAGSRIGMLNAEGKYTVGYSNDVLATENWLHNLLCCIKSDPKIEIAVPVCNAISNGQRVHTDYGDDMDKMQEFAKNFNKSNPSMWEERPRLMPFIALVPTALYTMGFSGDQRYIYGDFSDDDVSVYIRRAGMKQILARDTFMHHFGSVTLSESQLKNNSLQKMRDVFYDKWGVDAWDSLGYVNALFPALEKSGLPQSVSLLAIEPRFGGTPLRIKTMMKNDNKELAAFDAVCADTRFSEDASGVFESAFIGEDYFEILEGIKNNYNLIVFCKNLEEFRGLDAEALIYAASRKLETGGKLFFFINNPSYLKNIKSHAGAQIHGGYREAKSSAVYYDIYSLAGAIQKYSNVTVYNIKGDLNPEESESIPELKKLLGQPDQFLSNAEIFGWAVEVKKS